MRRHKLDWDRTACNCQYGNEHLVPKKAGTFLTVWGPVGFSSSTVLYDIALTGQCRLSEGRKQSLKELTAVTSCYRVYSSVLPVNILLSSPLCSSSQHSALQSALFLQSTFRSPVRSVPSVNIPLSSPLCSSSQHSTFQSALFLQSTFHSPVRSVPPVNIPLSSPFCYVTSNWWRCHCHVSTNIDLLLYTKPLQLLHRPFTARASGRLPVTSCRNRGAATAVPTVCSEQVSILHHISAFICYSYVFLMSVAVYSLYKQYGTVTVPLFRLTYCYTVSTVYKYKLYQSNYKYLCALYTNILSLNIFIIYSYQNWEVCSQCCHIYVTSHGGCCWRCIMQG